VRNLVNSVKDQTVLITGASGLLGRATCKKLIDLGIKVFGLVRKVPDNPIDSVSYIQGDLTHGDLVELLPAHVDSILHLAQSDRFRDFPDGAVDVLMVNTMSTVLLLDYALRASATTFIYASSGGMYARSNMPLTETSPVSPPGELGSYLGSKFASEILVQSYARLMQAIIVRPFFIFGPGQNHNMLIPRLLDTVASESPVKLDGQDGITINPIYVDDAADALVRCLTVQEGGIFNLAGAESLSIREIGEHIARLVGKSLVVSSSSKKPENLIGSISKMSSVLGAPSASFVQGLELMVHKRIKHSPIVRPV
jgi:UDP-glucose 4-epimerase